MTSAVAVAERTASQDQSAVTPQKTVASSPPLARYLVVLLAMAIVPLLVVASVLIWRQALSQRVEAERALLATAHVTSIAVDRQLDGYRLMLEALAESELLDRRDFAAFHAYAKRVADAQGAVFVSVFEPSGRQVLNTARPFGAPLGDPFSLPPAAEVGDQPPAGDVTSLRRVFATGLASNSDLFIGLTSRRVQFTVDVPVIRGGKVVYAINAAFMPDKVNELLAAHETSRAVRSAVLDRRGFIVGRWKEAERYVGTRARPETIELMKEAESGSAFTHSVDGTFVLRSFVRSPASGWVTAVSIDAGEVRRAELSIWLIWGSAALAALLLSVVLATRLARSLSRSIGRLADAASADEAPGDYGLHSRELDRLRDALVAAKESRANALRDREAALMAEARSVEAEAANRDKDRFMATVVHELRTPLAALSNVAAALKAGAGDERAVGILQRQISQLARLVDDLLESARINFGKFSLQLARLDLREVVNQALQDTSLRHDGRHRVEVQLPPDPVIVEGDRARLTQVIGNLVDNAMKFTPDDGVVRVELAIHVGHAVLAVSDSGRGIDPQFLPHIFDRFAQAPGTQGAGEGLGLGLAVARDLVLAHHGHIEAASDGQGARFTVTLPLAAAAA